MGLIFKQQFFGLSIYRIGHFQVVRTWRSRILTIKFYRRRPYRLTRIIQRRPDFMLIKDLVCRIIKILILGITD